MIVIDTSAQFLRAGHLVGEQQLFLEQGIAVIPFDEEQLQLARAAFRRFGRGRHPARLNFSDCFAYGLAKQLAAPLLFKGEDFRQTDIESALA